MSPGTLANMENLQQSLENMLGMIYNFLRRWTLSFLNNRHIRKYVFSSGKPSLQIKYVASKSEQWTHSMHISSQMENHLLNLNKTLKPKQVEHHKKKGKSKIKSDGKDRMKLCSKLELCIDPLNRSLGSRLTKDCP